MGAIYNLLPDGSLLFKRRGLPPTEVPGYEADPGDPYLFHLTLPPCQARVLKLVESACCPGAGQYLRHCTKFGYYLMTPKCCKDCAATGQSVVPLSVLPSAPP